MEAIGTIAPEMRALCPVPRKFACNRSKSLTTRMRETAWPIPSHQRYHLPEEDAQKFENLLVHSAMPPPMPRGTHHTLEGLLAYEGRDLALFLDDGGRWRLDPIRGLSKLVGLRVRISGMRSDFDLIDVEQFERL